MIKKYRKKPIEIDAIQYTGNNVSEIENFVGLIFYIIILKKKMIIN